MNRRNLAWNLGLAAAFLALGGAAAVDMVLRKVDATVAVAPGYETDAGDIVFGPPDAPATILVMVSLTCSHCQEWERSVLPEVLRRLVDTGRARLVLRDFPLDDPSLAGAAMLRALPQAERLAARSEMQRDLREWHARAGAGAFGTSGRAAAAALADAAAIRGLTERRAEDQRRYGIRATPAFVVGKRIVTGGQTAAALAMMVAEAAIDGGI